MTGEEITHLKSLRIFAKDKKIEIRDGQGGRFVFSCPAHSKDLVLELSEPQAFSQPRALRLGGAIPKGNRLDWMLQKCTELGTTDFYFCNFERSVRSDFSEDRAQRILVEACIQSGRTHLPNLHYFKNWKELFAHLPRHDFRILDPRCTQPLEFSGIGGEIYLIGPEGGFGNELSEWEALSIPGFNLGGDILRMETAYVHIASLKKQRYLEIKV